MFIKHSNPNPKAWCNKRYGDIFFQTIYSKLKEIELSKYSCHLYSNWLECQQFRNDHKELFIEFKKKLYEVRDGGFARIANNDDCVKSTITSPYWEMYSEIVHNPTVTLTSF